jgi:hypothetical protein
MGMGYMVRTPNFSAFIFVPPTRPSIKIRVAESQVTSGKGRFFNNDWCVLLLFRGGVSCAAWRSHVFVTSFLNSLTMKLISLEVYICKENLRNSESQERFLSCIIILYNLDFKNYNLYRIIYSAVMSNWILEKLMSCRNNLVQTQTYIVVRYNDILKCSLARTYAWY